MKNLNRFFQRRLDMIDFIDEVIDTGEKILAWCVVVVCVGVVGVICALFLWRYL